MIKIRIKENENEIEEISISGHAMAGEYGADLVCCSVSAISVSGINALDVMFSGDCQLEMENNRIHIQVLRNSKPLQVALNMLKTQLLAMAESEPKRISMKTS